MERTVLVWGKPCVVTVHRKPGTKSGWIAAGEYGGERFSSADRSEAAAVRRWTEAARSIKPACSANLKDK
jgi:hypothetical protein